MGGKLRSQTKSRGRSRKKTRKRPESEISSTMLHAQEMSQEMSEEPTEHEVTEDKPIIVSEREAVREALEMVAKMPYPGVGLRTIAGILRGEIRANWLSYIARTESWGVFFPNPLPVIENFVRELVRLGYLEGIHFVRLTEKGQRVLENKEPPAIRKKLKLVSQKFRPLLWKLLLLRARLVNKHKAPGLFKDELILQLIEKQPDSLDELKKLKGVGKFIAQNLGEEIVHTILSFQNAQEENRKG